MAGSDLSWILAFLPMVPTLDACAKASAAGFVLWSPSLTEWHRRPDGRGRIWTEAPAYPGYLLLAPDVPLAALRRRFELWRIRPLRGEGATWTEAQVDELRELEASWHFDARRPRPARARYAAGARVVVVQGLFVGRRGGIEADDGGQLVAVTLAAPVAGTALRPGGPGGSDTPVLRRVTLPATCLAAAAP